VCLRCASGERPPPSSRVDPAATGTAPGSDFDDSAIATIAATISDGQEVRVRLAMRRAVDARVRGFAASLEADLPAAKIAMMQLGPHPSVVDDELTQSTVSALRDLDLRRGSDFDRAFLASEQNSLVAALRVLEQTLIPKAANEDLARRLSRMRAVLADELSRANTLEGALSATP
jgi:predicted outer membrane protein